MLEDNQQQQKTFLLDKIAYARNLYEAALESKNDNEYFENLTKCILTIQSTHDKIISSHYQLDEISPIAGHIKHKLKKIDYSGKLRDSTLPPRKKNTLLKKQRFNNEKLPIIFHARTHISFIENPDSKQSEQAHAIISLNTVYEAIDTLQAKLEAPKTTIRCSYKTTAEQNHEFTNDTKTLTSYFFKSPKLLEYETNVMYYTSFLSEKKHRRIICHNTLNQIKHNILSSFLWNNEIYFFPDVNIIKIIMRAKETLKNYFGNKLVNNIAGFLLFNAKDAVNKLQDLTRDLNLANYYKTAAPFQDSELTLSDDKENTPPEQHLTRNPATDTHLHLTESCNHQRRNPLTERSKSQRREPLTTSNSLL